LIAAAIDAQPPTATGKACLRPVAYPRLGLLTLSGLLSAGGNVPLAANRTWTVTESLIPESERRATSPDRQGGPKPGAP